MADEIKDEIVFGDPETWDKKVVDFENERALKQPKKKVSQKILKALGPLGTPTGFLGLTAATGVDLKDPLERLGLEAEAIMAPALVEATKEYTKRPIVQRLLNLGLSPAMAMRAARVAQPLGIASLVGEGIYQLGKSGVEEYEKLQKMTPEEKEEYLAEQEERLGISP